MKNLDSEEKETTRKREERKRNEFCCSKPFMKCTCVRNMRPVEKV